MAYLSGYSKYKVLTLTGGADGAQTDYQLKLAVSYEAAMQGDFDDIRFTQADGITLVDAWAELIVTDTSATVWVEFPTTPANTVEQTYYMYYDHATPVSDWDGDATFQFFDDFLGSSLDTDKWELVNTPAITVSGGLLTINNNDDSEYIRSKTYTTSYGKAIRTRQRDLVSSYYPGNFSFGERTSNTGLSYVAKATYTADEYALATNDGAGAESFPRINENSDDSYHLWDITWLSDEAKLIRDGSTLGTNTLEIPSASIKIALGGQMYVGTYYGNSWGRYDWVFVRKYVSNPPTYEFGAEQSVPTGGNPYWYYNLLKRRN